MRTHRLMLSSPFLWLQTRSRKVWPKASLNGSQCLASPSKQRRVLLLVAAASFFLVQLLFALVYLKAASRDGEKIINDSPEDSGALTVATVAHVVSLIKCNRGHMVTGFLDAAAVLRHSIHQQSNFTGKSRYSYHMVAMVHPNCSTHARTLAQLGYETKVVAPPISVDELPPGFYRDHVHWENCCGIDEFIKLLAYNLTDFPITVHWDMDVMVLQPMDSLFDAMLFAKNSSRGQTARGQLELQHPDVPLPDVIDAFITRDITSSEPWEIYQGVQGGFVVARPNPKHLETYYQFIKQANFTGGRGKGTGWGGLGYGGFQGAMAYQGVLAYFYDQLQPNTAVELNVCRWNQVVADVIWRGPQGIELNGTCREHPKPHKQLKSLLENTDCEDCRITPVELVKTVHYTACRKPWECTLPFPWKVKDPGEQVRFDELTNVTTCGLLFRKWFEARHQVEMLLNNTNYTAPLANGGYEPQYFLGYCRASGHYIPMNGLPPDLDVNTYYF